ncbi:L-rhamnose-binding lectin ELEL-1-like [Branchiostoma floridae x Branchiostoma japonicum]
MSQSVMGSYSQMRLTASLVIVILVTLGQIWSLPDDIWGTPQDTRRVCEHQTLSLTCIPGLTVQVSHALYGRTQHGLCAGPVYTTNCRSPSSLSTVRNYCQGRRTCSVPASNGVFGDPCVGTFKYLEVTFQCIGRELLINICMCATFAAYRTSVLLLWLVCTPKLVQTQAKSGKL